MMLFCSDWKMDLNRPFQEGFLNFNKILIVWNGSAGFYSLLHSYAIFTKLNNIRP